MTKFETTTFLNRFGQPRRKKSFRDSSSLMSANGGLQSKRLDKCGPSPGGTNFSSLRAGTS